MVPVMMCMIMGCVCNDFKDFGNQLCKQKGTHFIRFNFEIQIVQNALGRYIKMEILKREIKTVKGHPKLIIDPRVSSSQYECSHSELAHSPTALSASGSSIPDR